MTSRKRKQNSCTFDGLLNPNFEEFSCQYPEFGSALQVVKQRQREKGGSFASNITQEFSIAITRALLHTYFSMSLPQVPSLSPAIPNRYYFVRWINQYLLPLSENDDYFENSRQPNLTRYGIDIGSGATCIYPLLFCAPQVHIEGHLHRDWVWFASDIEKKSVQMARENVKANRLESKIQVVQVSATDAQVSGKINSDYDDDKAMEDVTNNNLQESSAIPAGPLRVLVDAMPAGSRPSGIIDVVMTNPPFHDPAAPHVTEPHRKGDHRIKTKMTEYEASYPGGEEAFILDLLGDSLYLLQNPTGRIQSSNHNSLASLWYASMFGKKSSWHHFSKLLTYMLGPARVQSTEFSPGHLARWFIAWTYCMPNIRSPLAAYHHRHEPTDASKTSFHLLSFDVHIHDSSEISRGATSCVIDRIVEYCKHFRDTKLLITRGGTLDPSNHQDITLSEKTPKLLHWDEQQLRSSILRILRYKNIEFMDFLPTEGHFILDVSVQARGNTKAAVAVSAYVHSQYGKTIVDKIANNIQSEVCRTNRRWRRIFERQKKQAKHTEHHPMES